MPMTLKTIYRYLEKFSKCSKDRLSRKQIEKMYDVLLDFLVEHDDELDDETCDVLHDILDACEYELDRQDKKLENLSAKLINDPAYVEYVLSRMSFNELLQAEKKGQRMKSSSLRKQFANMIRRQLPKSADLIGNC